jgi:hypothetical protein
MEEMWENADSVKSEEQGISWLLRLKDDIRKIHEKSPVAPMSSSQSDDDAITCSEEWDKDWFPSNGLEAESSPERHTPESSSQSDDDETGKKNGVAAGVHVGHGMKIAMIKNQKIHVINRSLG